MRLRLILPLISSLVFLQAPLFPHCQMPCGIYHDDMVFDQVDQYVETMFKGYTVLKENKFATLKEKNEFVRWVIEKENASNEVASLITTYFLQQKIKPDEDDTVKRLTSAHKLLVLAMLIKQNSDHKYVDEFADTWEKFKAMFHVEGYECQIEILKQKKRQEALKKAQEDAQKHDADHQQGVEHTHNTDHNHSHSDEHAHSPNALKANKQ